MPQAFCGLHILHVDTMQVRSLRAVTDYKLLQSLPAPAHTIVSASQGSDGSVFAASGTDVWQLRPTPLLEQVCVRQLLHHASALAIASLASSNGGVDPCS